MTLPAELRLCTQQAVNKYLFGIKSRKSHLDFQGWEGDLSLGTPGQGKVVSGPGYKQGTRVLHLCSHPLPAEVRAAASLPGGDQAPDLFAWAAGDRDKRGQRPCLTLMDSGEAGFQVSGARLACLIRVRGEVSLNPGWPCPSALDSCFQCRGNIPDPVPYSVSGCAGG